MTTLRESIKYKLGLRQAFKSYHQDAKYHGILGAYKARRQGEPEGERGIIGLAKAIKDRVLPPKAPVEEEKAPEEKPEEGMRQMNRVLPQCQIKRTLTQNVGQVHGQHQLDRVLTQREIIIDTRPEFEFDLTRPGDRSGRIRMQQ